MERFPAEIEERFGLPLGQRVMCDGYFIDAADVALGGRLRAQPPIATRVATGVAFDELPHALLRLLEQRLG